MSRIRRFFRDNELEAPNVGSWARRVAAALETTEGHGSWARRAVVDIDAENDLGPGSWKTRLEKAIQEELLASEPGVIYSAHALARDIVGAQQLTGISSTHVLARDVVGAQQLTGISSTHVLTKDVVGAAQLTGVSSAHSLTHDEVVEV